MKYPLICTLMLSLAVHGSMVVAQTKPFTDVPKDHWAYQAVMELKEKGILIGYPDERSPTPLSYQPRKLRLYIGGAFGPSYRVEWKENTLVYQQLDRAEPTLTRTITPTPEAWKRFWKRMEEVKLWNWHARYETKGLLDGTLWEVEIEQTGTKGKSKTCQGRNGYPRNGDVTKSTNGSRSSKVFQHYCAAVEELVGKQPFH